ncbi:MAG: hypothetical protein FWE69_07505 [Clostridiales bacterium]|nr:hypothetical protein [Clostridiales bacterium]
MADAEARLEPQRGCAAKPLLQNGRLALLGTPPEVFAHGEALKAMGLALPQATVLAGLLRERGLLVPAGICTTGELTIWLITRYCHD